MPINTSQAGQFWVIGNVIDIDLINAQMRDLTLSRYSLVTAIVGQS